jgi:hypothetical protein
MESKRFLSLYEISERYSLPISTVRRWSSERRFPLYKISNRVRVSIDEWETWLEQFHHKRVEQKSPSKSEPK